MWLPFLPHPCFSPFNLAKGGMNMAATLLLYPPVVGALRRAGVVPPSQSGQGKTLNAGFLLFALGAAGHLCGLRAGAGRGHLNWNKLRW